MFDVDVDVILYARFDKGVTMKIVSYFFFNVPVFVAASFLFLKEIVTKNRTVSISMAVVARIFFIRQ